MNNTFMKERPVFPLLMSMALPNVISMLVNSLYNIVDSLFVARINESAMTALSLVFPVQNLLNAIAIGFGIGINALVALCLGAGEHEKADQAATHGMVFSLLHGILGSAIAIAIMPSFLGRFTTDAEVLSMGLTYSYIVFGFATVNMASLAFEKIFQSVGRMKVTMVALIVGCVGNIILDPLLIFGIGPFPAMGIAGAALATGIGQALSTGIYLVVYASTELPVRLRRACLKLTKSWTPGSTPSASRPSSTWRFPLCWTRSSTACWPRSQAAMWWCWASTTNYRHSSTCPPTASCRECVPSSATTTVPGSTNGYAGSTRSPSS